MLRTVRHFRPEQLLPQIRHAIVGVGRPVVLDEPAPSLRVASPAAPFLLPASHIRFDGARRLEFLNREVELGDELDWLFAGEGPLWSYHLHQFEYLRLADVSPERRGELMLDWIDRHTAGIGWDPHPISLRVLAWAKLLLTDRALSLDDVQRARVRHSMAEQLETLHRNLEVRLQANHLLSNLLCVVFGGVLFEGARADGWLGRQDALVAELRDQIHPDGGHEERSPMYHSLLLENLLDLRNVMTRANGRGTGALAAEVDASIGRMLAALRLWTHPDGRIALFADSAHGIAQTPAALGGYAAALGIEGAPKPVDGLLRDTGYARLGSDPFTLIASLAGPSPTHQPGHAHCDALSFELSCGEERVVSDTGVYEYMPGPLRDQSRATRSHATLEVEGREQAEVWSGHRVGGRPRVTLYGSRGDGRVEASCAAWSTPDTLHRRVFAAADGVVEIADSIEGRARPVRLALPLAPGVKATLDAVQGDAVRASLRLPSGRCVEVSLPSPARWTVEPVAYFPEFGCRLERDCLVGVAEDFGSGVWRFRALG
jgi:hypothetical protein